MRPEPLSGFIGAEIGGLDLAAPISETTASALRDALERHHVIVVRDQQLTLTQQKTVTTVFGHLMALPYVTPMPEDAHVIAVRKEADEINTGVFGGDWHSDFSFLDNPPAGSLLRAVVIPPFGGDTVWVNQAAAYRSLADHLRAVVDNRSAIHIGAPYGVSNAPAVETRANASIEMTRGDPGADREVIHPSVITSPETGERSLFLNPMYTTRFEGMTEIESRPILQEIYRHAVRPDFGYRHRWRVGDLLVWNNRTTMHFATNDYDGHRRLLYRTTFGRVRPE